MVTLSRVPSSQDEYAISQYAQYICHASCLQAMQEATPSCTPLLSLRPQCATGDERTKQLHAMTTPASEVAQVQVPLLADESGQASPSVPVQTPQGALYADYLLTIQTTLHVNSRLLSVVWLKLRTRQALLCFLLLPDGVLFRTTHGVSQIGFEGEFLQLLLSQTHTSKKQNCLGHAVA